MNCRSPLAPYDWEAELDRFDDHLADAETAEPLLAPSSAPGAISWMRPERSWQSVLGLIGSGVIAVLTVLAFVVLGD